MCLLITPVVTVAGDWPQFRGPEATGLSAETNLPTEWSADKNVLWKAKVPGYAWSSPIVVGDKIILTTAISDKQPKPRAGFGPGGPGGPGGFGPGGRDRKPPDMVYRWEVYCLDRSNGKVLWHQLAVEKKPSIPTHSSNTYASETPVTDGERIYAYFGMMGLYCFDLAGKEVWHKEMDPYKMMASWGTGSSPVLDGERVFVQCDNEEKSFLIAFDKKTGKELWKADRPDRSSWSTPFLWKTKQRTELVACGNRKVRSYDPATGKVLWELSTGGGRENGNFSSTPVASDEMLYFGSGSGMGAGPLVAVKAGASGDITLKEGETSNKGVAWTVQRAGPNTASPLLYNGHLYILGGRGGSLSCYNAKTGEAIYKSERLPQARGFTSSPWAYDGKVFCLDDSGQTFVVKAGDKFEVLGKNKIDEMFWSSPAISGGALYLRGLDTLYCIKQ
jgi:outer membrane protein assembly factor BamB